MEKIIVAAEERSLNDDIQSISTDIHNLKGKATLLSESSKIRKQFTECSHSKYVSRLLKMKKNIGETFDQIKEESDHRKQHYIDRFNMDQLLCTDIKNKVPKLKRALEPSTEKATHFINVKRTREFVDETNEKMSGIIGAEVSGVFEELPLEGEHKILEVLATEANFKMSVLRFRVRINEDKRVCEIVGICQIGNGNLVLADKANKRLKQLNREYTVIAHYELQEIPNDVCAVDDTEVAVAMQNKTVLIFNVGTEFEIVRSLEMSHGCLQVAYHDANIYIADSSSCKNSWCTCRTKIFICDKYGKAIADFETSNDDTNCSFIYKRAVTISHTGQIIYVAHSDGNIISFDPEGNKTVGNTQFQDVVSLCTNKSGNPFACTSNSKEVIELSPTENFKKSKTVLSLADRDITPRAICYDEKLGRVVVGTETGDYIYLE